MSLIDLDTISKFKSNLFFFFLRGGGAGGGALHNIVETTVNNGQDPCRDNNKRNNNSLVKHRWGGGSFTGMSVPLQPAYSIHRQTELEALLITYSLIDCKALFRSSVLFLSLSFN